MQPEVQDWNTGRDWWVTGASVLEEKTPRTEAIWSDMQHLHLSHLLKVWLLLLSQLPREIPAQNHDKIIKACGRELVRIRIGICGSIIWGERAHQQVREPRQASEPLEGEHPCPPTPHRLLTSNYWLRAGHQPFRKAPALPGSRALGLPTLGPDSGCDA